MSNLSNRLKVLMRADEVPMSDAWGKLIDDLKASEVELLAYREAAKEPVAWRCNSTGPNSHVVTLSKVVADSWNYKGIKSIPLYAAPPLSAVNSPAIPDDWVSVSDRLPEKDGNYWGWWSDSKRQGPVWFIKSDLQSQFQSSEITHWMPLPAAPNPEVGDNTHADGQIQCATTDFVRGRL